MKIHKRVDIKIGYACNNNCLHCVAADKRNLRDRTTEGYKRELRKAIKNGPEELVITGGEPTIRADIFELVTYAKKLGFKKIQMQTNGRMFCYRNFARRMVRVSNIHYAIPLHANNSELHEKITRVKGSFNQTVEGIKNLLELNQSVTVVTVVTKLNYKILPEMTNFLSEIGIRNYQLDFVHPMGNAWRYFDEVVPNITEVTPYLHRAIDNGLKEEILVRTEGIPFCFMQTYEKYISELYIPPTEVRLIDKTDFDFEGWIKTEGKAKGPQCVKCRYNPICLGTWREYTDRKGFNEFKLVEGTSLRKLG